MKTETQIAQENIERKISFQKMTPMNTAIFGICKTHKATCQRFLEFLRKMKGRQQRWLTYQLIPLSKKMVDLENAIKLYNEAGI